MSFLVFTNCTLKKSDLLSEGTVPVSAVLKESILAASVNQISAPIVYNITYSNVLNTTLIETDVILQASLTAFDIVGQTVTLNISGADLCTIESTVIVTVRLDSVTDLAGNVSAGSVFETYT